ncbi:MAG: carbon-nitrogen hydrolase family protein [Acidobacteria bacterium]|nr:MAG: carbon-nitrogen hydrolase family protein [Acidobacteriota bacterium]REK03806.1 MAG: carbon-nitrogen hydrolase family protein [Acidobacteriota bacterium]
MSHIAIAAIQMRIHNADNRAVMIQRLETTMALFPWVQLVLFSELAPFGADPSRAVELPGPVEEQFQQIARQHRIWLIPGSLYERRDGRIYNTAPIISPQGVVVDRYRKQFPFLPYEAGIAAGDRFVTFDVPDTGRIGVSICYDMWFPETTRTLAAMGAELILHPSLTGTIDRDVELSIARSSAVTNQCYFVDVNGLDAGGVGRSIIVGPAGDVLHVAGEAPEIIPIELDLGRVRRGRERGLRGLGQPLKSFRDRQVDFTLYRESPYDGYLGTLGRLEKPARPGQVVHAPPAHEIAGPPSAEEPGEFVPAPIEVPVKGSSHGS